MPTEQENVQYLYLVLTNGGPPSVDWPSVCRALDLSNGATTKRWSRLKQAIEADKNPGPTAYELLWLMVKHSTRDKAPDWNDIAKKCGTTSGAASKRYSRMKQAFEKDDGAPTTPAKRRTAANPTSPTGATPTPKRKRAPAGPRKKAAGPDEKLKPDGDEEVDSKEYLGRKPKRARGGTAKPKSKANPTIKQEPDASNTTRPPNGHLPTPTLSGTPHFSSMHPTEAPTLIKAEPGVENGVAQSDGSPDQFYDAQDYVGEEEDAAAQERVQEWLEEI